MTAALPITRLARPTYSYDEKEAQAAYDNWGCNCGPSALATMLNLKPDDVRPHIPDFNTKRYTNPTMMKAALKSLGVGYDRGTSDLNKEFTYYGLVRIQWEGPWCNPGVPMAARYRLTHWVGSMRWNGVIFVFDINSGWERSTEWASKTVPFLTENINHATGGWHSTHRWELSL